MYIKDRIRNKELWSKIVSAQEAASVIKDGMTVATSGFTSSGCPKAVPLALAERARSGDKVGITLWTGASVGPEIEEELAKVGVIKRRAPYYASSNKSLFKAINNGTVNYTDFHLSQMAHLIRYGFLGEIDVAIIEAAAITEDGDIIPTTSVGNSATFAKFAETLIVEVNTAQPAELEGMSDIYELEKPPFTKPIPITKPGDRIGTPYIKAGIDKIKYIVASDIPDKVIPLREPDEGSKIMAQNLIDFFKYEIKNDRLPKNLLPLQSGVGNISNAVLINLAQSDFQDLSVYSEVLQDGVFDLIDMGKVNVASGSGFTPSPDVMERFRKNSDLYRERIILRPLEISNNPELIRRLGVIAMNTPLEADIYGHCNSTHVMGYQMRNGIGGSGDFMRNGYLTIFIMPSIAQDGRISRIVPRVSHVDHTEHDVQVLITEQGVADLRGLSPRERAKTIIENCAHPDYKPLLREYFDTSEHEVGGHSPNIIEESVFWHVRYRQKGSMK